MIHHTVLMRFASGADRAERDAILGRFIALGDHLGHVSAFSCGPVADAQARADGFTHVFAVVLETEAACATYQALPEYAAALERLSRATEGGGAGVRISVEAQDR